MAQISVLFAALFLVTTPEANASAFKGGIDLLTNCEDENSLFRALCDGYIVGISDALSGGNDINGIKACSPDGVTTRQVTEIAMEWLRGHPELLQYAAPGLIAEALAAAYPCR